jgi:hypothetical protein
VFNVTETNTEESKKARFPRVCQVQRTRHVWREESGTWETLSVPAVPVGLTNQKRGRLMTDRESD